MGVMRNTNKIVNKKPQMDRLPTRPRLKLQDTIKMDIKETRS